MMNLTGDKIVMIGQWYVKIDVTIVFSIVEYPMFDVLIVDFG